MINYKTNVNLESVLTDTINSKEQDGNIVSFDISTCGKSIIPMFKDGVYTIEEFKNYNIKNIYAVDDFSYENDISHMWDLYNSGMRMLSITGDDSGIYGSGEKTSCGLTYRGGILVRGAISLGIALNISNTNSETIKGIIGQYKDEKKQPLLITDSKKSFDMLDYLGTFETFLLCNIDNVVEYERLLSLIDKGYPIDKIILTGGTLFNKTNIFGKELLTNKVASKMLKKHFTDTEVLGLVKNNFLDLYETLTEGEKHI